MKSQSEIIKLINDEIEVVKDIGNIPSDLPSTEKAVQVDARQKILRYLEYLLEAIEEERSPEKEIKHPLIP